MPHVLTSLRIILTFCIVFGLAAGALADTIRLKDGSMVKGRIVSFGGGKFVVAIGDGSRRKEMSFTAGEIESIQFDQITARSTVSAVTIQPVSKVVYTERSRPIPKAAVTENASKSSAPPIKSPISQPVINSEPLRTVKPNLSNVKPVEIAVRVLADNTSNGWTNSGWVVKKGQTIKISGDGEISLGAGKTTGPSGDYELDDTGKLLKSVPTGALIAVVGDDNNDFIYVGNSREFTATRDGALFLGVNEGNLNDNSGSYNVKIEISPGVGG